MSLLLSRLYVVCDVEVCDRAGWDPVDFASACFEGGATLLQVRAKVLAARDFLAVAEAIVSRARAVGAAVIINDRADIAALTGASGVHVGQDDLQPTVVRRIVGHAAWVGVSTHSDEQLSQSLRQPVTYVATGPVFETATKATGYSPHGLDRVRSAAALTARAGLPLVAIGGITLPRARAVIEAGAQSVAVISDLLATGNPAERVREYLGALD